MSQKGSLTSTAASLMLVSKLGRMRLGPGSDAAGGHRVGFVSSILRLLRRPNVWATLKWPVILWMTYFILGMAFGSAQSVMDLYLYGVAHAPSVFVSLLLVVDCGPGAHPHPRYLLFSTSSPLNAYQITLVPPSKAARMYEDLTRSQYSVSYLACQCIPPPIRPQHLPSMLAHFKFFVQCPPFWRQRLALIFGFGTAPLSLKLLLAASSEHKPPS
ncbi:hypothetical protein K438DRAFT_1980269 [Mycena galopus ATCC 62051]|nr:hypothetical protein K438DRAFT_1980269 [Mycena galopus ATCC 62051]